MLSVTPQRLITRGGSGRAAGPGAEPPATGTVTIGACSGCKLYAGDKDGRASACGNSGIDYPKASFTLPPGLR